MDGIIQISEKEALRLMDKFPYFSDSNKNFFVVVDGILCQSITTAQDVEDKIKFS